MSRVLKRLWSLLQEPDCWAAIIIGVLVANALDAMLVAVPIGFVFGIFHPVDRLLARWRR